MSHLGGHNWVTHVDLGLLQFFYNELNCRSLLDVGCGPAGNVIEALKMGYRAIGIDGDPELQKLDVKNHIIEYDYTLGKIPTHIYWYIRYATSNINEEYYTVPNVDVTQKIDLCLSTEFLEHIEKKHLDNVFDTFRLCKYICITHALPHEIGGHHHVNCQTEEYWIQKFKEYGFSFSSELTETIRKVSTMKRNFVRNTGKVFINNEKL